MKRTVTKGLLAGILAWTLACGANALEITRYVKPGGTGKGTSWVDACGSINQALSAINTAGSGKVYIGPGTYTESVYIPDGCKGVVLLGGYSENNMEKPDFEKNKVVISKGTQSIVVVVGWNSENIRISGIHVVNADDVGIYMRGENIMVDRCKVSDCNVGIANEAIGSKNQHIEFCDIFNCGRQGVRLNYANIQYTSISNNGLGMYLEGCYVWKCYIYNNVNVSAIRDFTNDAGGIRMSQTKLIRCLILNNICDGEGGGVLVSGSGGNSFIFECIIANNTARDGGGICANEQTIVESCTITGNKATRFGGGICIGKSGWNDASAMTGSILWNNTAAGVAQQYGIYNNKSFNMTRSAIQGGGLLPETDDENGIIDVSPKNADPSKPCVALANVVPFSGAATTPEQQKQINAQSWELTAQSACIDRGGDFSKMELNGYFKLTLNVDRDKDWMFNPRNDGKYDIGAHEYRKPSPINEQNELTVNILTRHEEIVF
jgi:hypothetical protein